MDRVKKKEHAWAIINRQRSALETFNNLLKGKEPFHHVLKNRRSLKFLIYIFYCYDYYYYLVLSNELIKVELPPWKI